MISYEGENMHVQWCLKGMRSYPSFQDAEAFALLDTGIPSSWLFNNPTVGVAATIPLVQGLLSEASLVNHVNRYSAVAGMSPYISLSAGIVIPATKLGTRVVPAWQTAVGFATNFGKTDGYVYRLWTIVSPQPAPEVLYLSDEIRNLNLFRQTHKYQKQGEIAAKLVIPPVQIQYVTKISKRGKVLGIRSDNTRFVDPSKICNLLGEISA
jgi:hypothetical protein